MPSKSRAMVMISAHYVPSRIPFLKTVLDAIAGWDLEHVTVLIVTNDASLMEDPSIRETKADFVNRSWILDLEIPQYLEHPFLLTWHHRPFVKTWLEEAAEDDLFAYLEDDIVLTSENINYFIESVKLVRPYKLIPSFLRYEVRDGKKLVLDLTRPHLVAMKKSVTIDGLTFIAPCNPFWGGYILDRRLAEEFVDTPSYDLHASKTAHRWDVRARAAMGLAWETPPSGFKSRHVVPLRNHQPESRGMVWHCAQNYNENPIVGFGKIPIDEIFVRASPTILISRSLDRLRRTFRKEHPVTLFETTPWD